MSLSNEQLRTFQATLESGDDVKGTRTIIPGRAVEWTLTEIAILLRELKLHLSKSQS